MAVVWTGNVAPTDYDLPLTDHVHERHHGIRWPFASVQGEQVFYPNLDIRDYETGYAIDMELPGVSDAHGIKVEWTSKRDILVSGSIQRPEAQRADVRQRSNGKEELSDKGEGALKTGHKGQKKEEQERPTLLVGERRIGKFHRRFHLPVEVDVANLDARLEYGVLSIRVEKEPAHMAAGRAEVKQVKQ